MTMPMLQNILLNQLEELKWVERITHDLPIDILLHLVEQDCCTLTQDQGINLPPAANQSIGPLTVGPPRVAEGHRLLSRSLHFDHVVQLESCELKLVFYLHLILEEV
jgi:hypothetical protein